ncbi:MAG TPA: BatA domain-containing protein [Gemmatimonadaceae bacterium]
MSVLAPGYLVAAAIAGLVVVAWHLIAWRQPPDALLPTARFVPDEPTRRSARALRPSDLALLALRLGVLGLAGLAMARPVLEPPRTGLARVVAVERSRAVATLSEARDSALSWLEGATTGVVIAFDTAAAVVPATALDDTTVSAQVGQLSPALVALVREAERLRARHERVELAIVSPFDAGAWDAATRGIRALWPDSIHLMRVADAARVSPEASIDVRADDEDPVAAGIRLALAHRTVRPVVASHVVRGPLAASDSAWARETDGLLVHWPVLPSGAAALTGSETEPGLTGVHAGDVTLPGYFRARELEPGGIAVAWWLDGRVAARESSLGQGCVREIGFDVPDEGDLTLTPGFRRLAAALLAPCGGAGREGAATASRLDALAAPGADTAAVPGRAARAGIDPVFGQPNRLGAALLVAALVLLMVEQLVRRRPARPGETA